MQVQGSGLNCAYLNVQGTMPVTAGHLLGPTTRPFRCHQVQGCGSLPQDLCNPLPVYTAVHRVGVP